MIALNRRVKMSPHVLSQELSGEIVLLHLQRGTYYGLEGAGSAVWRLLHQPRSLAEIQRCLQAEFDAPPQRLAADLLALVRQLKQEGLVEDG